MNFEIAGNAALITASSRGLGKAAARSLVLEGVNVMVNGRNEERLTKTVEELNSLSGGRVIGQVGDITSKEDISKLVEVTYQEFGRLDHLVTSAGGPPDLLFEETADQDWYKSFDLLVMSVVRLVRESVQYLREGEGGTIVNITSISVKEAIPGLVLSNSVRMSVIGLMKTLARELGPEIRVNAILQSAHETDRITNLIESGLESGKFSSYQDGLDFYAADVPLKRIGQPEELGDLAAFLSSPRSGYLNGAAIPLDGGSSRSNL